MIKLTKNKNQEEKPYKINLGVELRQDLEYIAKEEGSKTLAPWIRMELTKIRNERLPLYKDKEDN